MHLYMVIKYGRITQSRVSNTTCITKTVEELVVVWNILVE